MTKLGVEFDESKAVHRLPASGGPWKSIKIQVAGPFAHQLSQHPSE